MSSVHVGHRVQEELTQLVRVKEVVWHTTVALVDNVRQRQRLLFTSFRAPSLVSTSSIRKYFRASDAPSMRARATEVMLVRVQDRRCTREQLSTPVLGPDQPHTEVSHITLDIDVMKVHRTNTGVAPGSRVELCFERRRLLCPGAGYDNARDLQIGDEVWAFLTPTEDGTYRLAAASVSFVDRLGR